VEEWISRKKAANASIGYEVAMDAFLEYGKRSEEHPKLVFLTMGLICLPIHRHPMPGQLRAPTPPGQSEGSRDRILSYL
jgi:hypothetical protein